MSETEKRLEACLHSKSCVNCEYYESGCCPDMVLQNALKQIVELKVQVKSLQVRNKN